jgi:acetyl esterase/lipase
MKRPTAASLWTVPNVRRGAVQTAAIAAIAGCLALVWAPRAGSGTTFDLSYGAHPAELLDAYTASSPGSPVLVVVHGGGWTKGDKTDVASTCETAVSRGYACFAVDYSLAPASHWPVQLGEMADALAWVTANAASYNGSRSRIGFWGYSAGGQLALEAAYRLRGIKAVVSWSGPTNLVSWFTSPGQRFLGCPGTGCLARQVDASPLFFALCAPPTFLAHSTGDPTVPFSQSAELDAVLGVLRIDHLFLHLSGTAHAQEMWGQAEDPTFAWLAGHL